MPHSIRKQVVVFIAAGLVILLALILRPVSAATVDFLIGSMLIAQFVVLAWIVVVLIKERRKE